MDLLLSKSPILHSLKCKTIKEKINRYVESATKLDIATGFITNDSMLELKRIVDFRQGELALSLFIGMNYLDGFTRSQYITALDLDNFLRDNKLGEVKVSRKAMYHGKMYAFHNGEKCLGAFVGSSNLGSFIGTSQSLIETDVHFVDNEAQFISTKIEEITNVLGEPISSVPEITEFKPIQGILDGILYVKKVTDNEYNNKISELSDLRVRIPLKTTPMSNLNAYYGKGKVRGRYSPRNYYEVEINVPMDTHNRDYLPTNADGPFTVITDDKYSFQLERQGTNDKNLRSTNDLTILGKWIKRNMEESGALRSGEKVTDETLHRFGKYYLVLRKSKDGKYWFLTME